MGDLSDDYPGLLYERPSTPLVEVMYELLGDLPVVNMTSSVAFKSWADSQKGLLRHNCPAQSFEILRDLCGPHAAICYIFEMVSVKCAE